ncbi:hypothetical protein STAS_19135 [Striga asiatica]|uniref:Uncharacterized protein n=1 Tax=Striga asiatica TaxID=4170 RepID=A0A5A7QAR7_STRAF|nr:hypothetical protein STAS_19135 [Striga asiatica]
MASPQTELKLKEAQNSMSYKKRERERERERERDLKEDYKLMERLHLQMLLYSKCILVQGAQAMLSKNICKKIRFTFSQYFISIQIYYYIKNDCEANTFRNPAKSPNDNNFSSPIMGPNVGMKTICKSNEKHIRELIFLEVKSSLQKILQNDKMMSSPIRAYRLSKP